MTDRQRPAPPGGAVFKTDWWQHRPAPSSFDRLITSWDLTFGSQVGDFCVGQVWGQLGADCWLLDQVHRARPDRHEKWVRVEPGHVIPAGQPLRVERLRPGISGVACVEYVRDKPVNVTENGSDWFIDSSWKPPLVLPTEPTWGMAITRMIRRSRWMLGARRRALLRPDENGDS